MKRRRPSVASLLAIALLVVNVSVRFSLASSSVDRSTLPPPPPRRPPPPLTSRTTAATSTASKQQSSSSRIPPPPPPRKRPETSSGAVGVEETEKASSSSHDGNESGTATTKTSSTASTSIADRPPEEDELTLRLQSILKSKGPEKDRDDEQSRPRPPLGASSILSTMPKQQQEKATEKPEIPQKRPLARPLPPPPPKREQLEAAKKQSSPPSIHDLGTPLHPALPIRQQQREQAPPNGMRRGPLPPPPPSRPQQQQQQQQPPLGMATRRPLPPPPRRPPGTSSVQQQQVQTTALPIGRRPPPPTPPPMMQQGQDRSSEDKQEEERKPPAAAILKPLPPRQPPMRPGPGQPQRPPLPPRQQQQQPPPQRQPPIPGQRQQQRRPPLLDPATGRPLQRQPLPPGQQQQQQPIPPQQRRPPPGAGPQQRRPQPRTGPQQQRQRPPPGAAAGATGQLTMYRRPQQQQQPWKRLWNRVEKGLDGLADLEDVVTGRAQQLYQTAKERIPGTTSGSTQAAASSSSARRPGQENSSADSAIQQLWSRGSRRPPPRKQNADAAPVMDMSRFQKKAGQAPQQQQGLQQKTTNTTATTAVGAAAAAAGKAPPSSGSSVSTGTAGGPTSRSSFQTKPATGAAVPTKRKIDWNDLTSPSRRTTTATTTRKMIRANGGASTPPSAAEQHRSFGGQQQAAGVTAAANSGAAQASASILTPEQQLSLDYMDEDSPSLLARVNRALPSLPAIPNPFRRDNSYSDSYSVLDVWEAGEKKEEKAAAKKRGMFGRRKKASSPATFPASAPPGRTSGASSGQQPLQMAAPLSDLMERCDDGKTTSLLTASDLRRCKRMGRSQAAWDLVALGFLVLGCHQVPGLDDPSLLPASLSQVFTVTLPGTIQSLISAFVQDGSTWAPLCFVSVLLTIQTRKLLYRTSITSVTQGVDATVSEQARYGALFLRLLSGATSSRDIDDQIRSAAHAQIGAQVALARLRTFCLGILASVVWTTFSIVPMLVSVVLGFVSEIISIEHWRTWPIQFKALGNRLILAAMLFVESLISVIGTEFSEIFHNPVRFAFGASIAIALMVVTHLPSAAWTRRPTAKAGAEETETDEDEEAEAQHATLTEQVSNLGVSSASRLSLLSDNGGMDAALERWRVMMPRDKEERVGPSMGSLIGLVTKGALSGTVLALPLLVHGYADMSLLPNSSFILRWDSLLDIAILLLFTQGLVWKTLLASVRALDVEGPVASFLTSLTSALQDRTRLLNAPPPDLQLQASVSPAAGIVVKDLWAAHTTKRAWAVRGANLDCKSGEVLLVLGDDSAGKSRLLTTIAEAIASPPRRSLTTNKVRGSITVGGVDVTKWDNRLLQKRFGLLLNDVRTISDLSQALSGLTLEEILEPSGGVRNFQLSHNPGPAERSCMMLALKIAGLYSTLLPRLPTKLNTVVTANEEETRPSPVRPHNQILSAAEWSKLLLARVIAQAVYDNESAVGTNDNVEKSLVGSLLLLDDATLFLSEVEEARFLGELRKTGAATLVTSNRWASGRFADRIAVMKNGAIVESGTHAELLNRGPQQSIYAAKWHAMTTLQQL